MALYTAIKPIYIFTSIFIPCPISMVTPKDLNSKITFLVKRRTILDVIRMILLSLVVFGCIFFRQLLKSTYSKHGVIVVSVEFAQYNFRVPMTIACLVLTYCKGFAVVNFLNEAVDTDEKFRHLGFNINYGQVRKVSRVAMGLIVAKILLQQVPFLMCGFNWTLALALDYIIYNIPLILTDALLLQWIVFLNILKIHFTTLNRLLKNLKYRQCWMLNDYLKMSKLSRNRLSENLDHVNVNILQTSSKMYDDLCEQGYKINKAFAWQFLIIIPTLFIMIIFTSFQVCQMIKTKINFQAKTLIFDVMYFLSFLEMIVPCVLLKEEADKFIDVLHEVDVSADGYSKLDEVLNFMILQTYHQRVSFSAYGIFSLDGTLMYSIFGALTTYLVILLQFDL